MTLKYHITRITDTTLSLCSLLLVQILWIWLNPELGMSCWIPVLFQSWTKQLFPFKLLTLGVIGPSGICIIGIGTGKMWHPSKFFESHHNTLNCCIVLFSKDTEKFCNERWSMSHSNLQDLLRYFQHNLLQQGSCQKQFLAKLVPKVH